MPEGGLHTGKEDFIGLILYKSYKVRLVFLNTVIYSYSFSRSFPPSPFFATMSTVRSVCYIFLLLKSYISSTWMRIPVSILGALS